MITKLKTYAVALAVYLGNGATRRALASLIAAVALAVGGKALDIEHVDTMIALFIPLAAAWSSNTPKIEGDSTEADKGGE